MFWLCRSAGVFFAVWDRGCVFGCVRVRVCFWLCGSAGVFLVVWEFGCVLVVWECGCVFGCMGVRVCFCCVGVLVCGTGVVGGLY